MAALVTLTDEQKAQLPKLINNLNFAIRNLNVGQFFTDVLAGTNTRHPNIRETGEIQRLLNLINLGTYHSKFGDLFIDLVQANGINITQNQKDDLVRALNKLNITLTRLQFGQLAGEAIKPTPKTPVGPGPVAKPTVTAGAAQTGKKIGDKLALNTLFTFGNSQSGEYKFDVSPSTAATISWPQAELKESGAITITATNKTDATVKATLNVTVLAKTVTGKGNITGKAPSDDVDLADIVTLSNGAAESDITDITGTDVTYSTATKKLTIGASASGDIPLTITAASGVDVKGTAVLKAVA
ncbi:hypothetical protein AH156_19630 [Salmonella enterica subsp. enterica serovar Enteritidis]|nr:hypothetical protein [Salmonella enterica subsp. enterica serovar Enteritidis]